MNGRGSAIASVGRVLRNIPRATQVSACGSFEETSQRCLDETEGGPQCANCRSLRALTRGWCTADGDGSNAAPNGGICEQVVMSMQASLVHRYSLESFDYGRSDTGQKYAGLIWGSLTCGVLETRVGTGEICPSKAIAYAGKDGRVER